MCYSKNTVFVVGHAKTNNDNAINKRFNSFFIAFVVDVKTNIIVDTGSSAMLDITNNFIRSLFVGRELTAHFDDISDAIEKRYFGSSQKAIMVAYKDAVKKYLSSQSNSEFQDGIDKR